MLFIYFILSLIMHIIDTKRHNSFFTTFNVVFMPIAIIILINNIFAYRYGFFKISDNVLILLIFTKIIFYIFSFWSQLIFSRGISRMNSRVKFIKIEDQHMIRITFFMWVSILVSLIKLIPVLSRFGMLLLTNEELIRTYYFNGISAHLMIANMVVFPVYYANQNKFMHKLTMGTYLILLFFVGVKYYVIITILATYFYISLGKKRAKITATTFKQLINMVLIISIVFFGSYLFQFCILGLPIGFTELFVHLWKYTAGPLIALGNQQYYFDLYTMINFIFRPFFNVYSIITNQGIEYSKTLVDYHQVHVSGSTANVTGVIGILFAAESKLLYFMFISLWSVFFNAVYYICKVKINDVRYRVFLSVTFAYGLLSFFSVYSTLLTFWETLVYPFILYTIIFYKVKDKSTNGTGYNVF